MLYYDKKHNHTQPEHHKHGEHPHEYGIPEEEPYISQKGDTDHDDILSVFADEIFPNDDLGI